MSPTTQARGAAVVAVERCASTGLTKPECHCAACLAALVAQHRRPRP